MKNLIPILAGIILPVFFTESTQAQHHPSSVLATCVSRLDTIQSCALQLLTGTSSNGEVWIRDYADLAPQWTAHKNTVATSQPSSLMQAIRKYVIVTGEQDLFFLSLSGKTILQRMESALEHLQKERLSEKYGLITGVAAIDPGDVQTGTGWEMEEEQMNAGDRAWFGGRRIQALIKNGYIQEAVDELKPMTNCVIAHNGFYGRNDAQIEKPKGSGNFRGEAGVLPHAITL